MRNNEASKFSAASAIKGYLFQFRYALIESLKRLRRSEEFLVSIETLDDVVFEPKGEPLELLQTKHHVNREADLTDASPDLWKTIRIWCEGLIKDTIPKDAALFLVTTASAAEGSVAYYLKLGHSRDVIKAVERLNATADSSTSRSNAPAYEAFRALTQEQKSALATAISVLDGIPVVGDLEQLLKEEVYFAAPQQHLDSFLQRLEGWWLRRMIKLASEAESKKISNEGLEAEISQLREQFKEDNLPIDDEIMNATVDASGYKDRMFVHQLRLIEVGSQRIFYAIRNYFRAFEQRSKWMREDLLLVGELDRYEGRLIDEWDILFQQMRDALGTAAAEDRKKRKAQELYAWVETGTHLPIRQGVIEPAIARGTYQMLADCQKAGWHPDFAERLNQPLKMHKV